jgi:hypothetical protein
VHFYTHSVDVEVGDVEDLELGHDGFGVSARADFADESDQALLCFDQWLEIGFAGVTGAPDADVSDKMGEDVGVVELNHGVEWEVFVGVSETVHVWLESFEDGVDVVLVFEVVLDEEAEEFGFRVLLEGFGSDLELDGLGVAGEEDRVDCFGWVGDEVVGVEVGDEAGEL